MIDSRLEKKHLRLILIIAVVLFALLALGHYSLNKLEENKPTWAEGQLKGDQSTIIYDREGEIVALLHGTEDRQDISIKEVPSHLAWSFIVIEDSRFYDHQGIDFRALGRAIIANLQKGFGSEGASTITQQLVKNALLSSEKSLERKLKEAWLAKEIEEEYSKEEILEMYLNHIYFGHGAYGIKAGAQVYFGKEPKELTLGEAAILAGIPKSPGNFSPYLNREKALERKERVLSLLYEQKKIDREQWEEAHKEPLRLIGLDSQNKYNHPYFIDHVIDEAINTFGISEDTLYRGGLRIYTALDSELQKIAEGVWADSENFPRGGENLEGAIGIMDHRKGEILALVGGREYQTKRGFNRATQLQRQPGSTFKPISAYGPALEKGYPPYMHIEDSPQAFGSYLPKNYGGSYRGFITMEDALRWSANLPAVKILNHISIDEGYSFAKTLGFNLKEEDRGLPLALGGLTGGISPIELANAYGAFANGGYYIKGRAITKIVESSGKILYEGPPPRKRVMKEQTAYLMNRMLIKVVEQGTGTRARIPQHTVAGKTGTTQLPSTPEFKGIRGNKDAWFVGYTPSLVAAVWIGYDQTTPKQYMKGIVGGSYPALLWKKVIGQYLEHRSPEEFFKLGEDLQYRGDFQIWKKPPEVTDPTKDIDKEEINQEDPQREKTKEENQEGEEIEGSEEILKGRVKGDTPKEEKENINNREVDKEIGDTETDKEIAEEEKQGTKEEEQGTKEEKEGNREEKEGNREEKKNGEEVKENSGV